MDADAVAALEELHRLRDEISDLTRGYSLSEEHTRWMFNVRHALNRCFGDHADLSVGFATLDWSIPSSTVTASSIHLADERGVYSRQLATARGLLSAAIERIEKSGVPRKTQAVVAAARRRIFISHGGEPPALAKVEEIVRTCGFEPVVVGKEASKGMSVDELVPQRMHECCCAIILATRDFESPGSGSPRGNVIHETGLAQQIFEDKVIYFLEQGVEFPSNIRPKVWESFNAENLEPLWRKIVKELRAFEFM